MVKRIEIQLSKSKMFLMFMGSALFVGLGIWLLIDAGGIDANDNLFITIAGIASILFFGTILIFIAVKMFDKKTGLVVDEHEIFDNSGGTSVGLIKWKDISGIRSTEVASAKFILIETSKPDMYIDKAGNLIAKKAMKVNHKIYGTPLSISSKFVKNKT